MKKNLKKPNPNPQVKRPEVIIPNPNKPVNEVWLGRTRSGKTWGAMDYFERWGGYGVLIDPKNEPKYNPDNPHRIRNWPGYQAYEVKDIDFSKSPKWTLHISGDYEEELFILTEYITEVSANDFGTYNFLIVVDEVDEFGNIHALNPSLHNLSVRGGGFAIHAIFLSQRPQMVHKTIYTQADKYRIYYINEKDVKHLEKECGLLVTPPPKYSYAYRTYDSDGEELTYVSPEQ